MGEAVSHSLFDLDAAARLPLPILFGTSSWTYPGWQGLIYHRTYASEKEFNARTLGEYAQFPWFRTVGVDSSFYNPLSRSTIELYASQLPERFRWASKVWEEITIPRYAQHKRYGAKAGEANPNFLNVDLFCERVLAPYTEFAPRAGPFIFEFQYLPLREEERRLEFIDRLKSFLSALPPTFRYATEIRNQELLRQEYFDALNAAGATHCFNHWTSMPPLVEQMKSAAASGGLTAPFYVARILTPLGVRYEDAVERFQPYDRLQAPIPSMRQDVVRLARRALERSVEVYILVNNRAEGNAPLTVDAIGRMIVGGTAE